MHQGASNATSHLQIALAAQKSERMRHYHNPPTGPSLSLNSTAPVSGCEYRRTITGSNGTKTEACHAQWNGLLLSYLATPRPRKWPEVLEGHPQNRPGGEHKANGKPVLARRSCMAQLVNAVIWSIRGHAVRTRNSVLDLPTVAESFPGNGQVVDPASPYVRVHKTAPRKTLTVQVASECFK